MLCIANCLIISLTQMDFSVFLIFHIKMPLQVTDKLILITSQQ